MQSIGQYTDLFLLKWLGRALDSRVPRFRSLVWNRAVRWLLKIRDKHGNVVPLVANHAQSKFARNATGRDIVLKARQLGITTWIAARFFISDRHPSGNGDRTGGARSTRRRRDFSHRAPVRGVLARPVAPGSAGHVTRQCRANCLPASRQRVPRGNRRRPERRPRAHHPQSALLGGGPLAARCRRHARLVARRRSPRRQHRARVHAQRRRRLLLRRVAALGPNRLLPPLFSVVVREGIRDRSCRQPATDHRRPEQSKNWT